MDVVETATAAHTKIPILGRKLGLRAGTPGRFCTGRYRFANRTSTEYVPCPTQQLATESGQCQMCADADEFRFAHRSHQGGPEPVALQQYMVQPHWLYVATFADANSKIGTAAESRKKSRIDEQGALVASYVAKARNGYAARGMEDAVTRAMAIPQSMRRGAKVAALLAAMPHSELVRHHHQVVEGAIDYLARSSWARVAELVVEAWRPPPDMDSFVGSLPVRGCTAYPHDLRSGEHGLYIDACVGSIALARIQDAPDAMRFVVDVGALKGLRVVSGDFASPTTGIQGQLF
jgi:hypothetical protein